MNLMTEAYITGVGAYLPGDPAGNTELAARFGDGSPRGAPRPPGARGERDQGTALCVNDRG
jgi:hypothetical protein